MRRTESVRCASLTHPASLRTGTASRVYCAPETRANCFSPVEPHSTNSSATPHQRTGRHHDMAVDVERALNPTTDIPVLIAGAGPTGLVLALWLTRLGVSVRIIDKTAEPGTTSRALAVSARTLELYRQL